jgi:hypothetical protein
LCISVQRSAHALEGRIGDVFAKILNEENGFVCHEATQTKYDLALMFSQFASRELSDLFFHLLLQLSYCIP